MSDQTSSRLETVLRRLVEAEDSRSHEPERIVLDGDEAVALTEALVAEAAGVTTSFPRSRSADLSRRLLRPDHTNLLGQRTEAHTSADPRAALATATGQATAGLRASAFLAGEELSAVRDQLTAIASRHLPLIAHLVCRAPTTHGRVASSGHESYHASADSGFFQLFARNAQEAADLTLIARRAAELALVPGLVAMDAGETARSLQIVRPITLDQAELVLGRPEDSITPPSPAQRILFGSNRRRVPRWFDLERPALTGPLCDPRSWALGSAGRQVFFDRHLQAILDESFARFAEVTGRTYESLFEYALDKARIVVIAQGAMVETACGVADHLRASSKLKVGVVGVRCLRPFPGAQIARLLRRRRAVLVLEKVGAPLAGDPPLTREVRSALLAAVECGQHGEAAHPGYPSYSDSDLPRLTTVLAGLGGTAVRGADLAAVCRQAEQFERSPLFMGIDLVSRATGSPKRQAMIDQVREAYPEASSHGIRATDAADIRPAGAFTLATIAPAEARADDLVDEVGCLVARVSPALEMRGRRDESWDAWGGQRRDVLTLLREGTSDPGDDLPADLTLVTRPDELRSLGGARRLATDSSLIIAADDPEAVLRTVWPAPLVAAARDGKVSVFITVPPDLDATTEGGPGPDALRTEHVLGALAAGLAGREEIGLSARRLLGARREILEETGGAGASARLEAFRAGLESLQPVSSEAIARVTTVARSAEPGVPMAIRHIRPQGEHAASAIDSLPRFWGEVGILYATGETNELSADPHLATGLVPSLSSTFCDATPSRTAWPQFDSTRCTGCARCWSACPDSAIGCAALTADQVIEAGMAVARTGGAATDALRPLVSKLGPALAKAFKKADPPPAFAGELLETAGAGLLDKMPFPEERKQAITEGFRATCQALAGLPVARTRPFFSAAEQGKPGGGELLTLAINPDACKGCLACVSVCEDEALVALPAAGVTEGAAEGHRNGLDRATWQLFEQLPDTAGATIERVRKDPQIGDLPGILLSKHCQFALAGGDGAEAGSGARLAIRLALAAAEHHLQPRLDEHLEKIESVRSQVSQRLRDLMAEALPAGDLQSLAQGLEAIHQSHVSLADLAARVNDAFADRPLDTVRLMRLVTVGQELADLQWRLSQGPFGLGRARVGVVLEPGELTRGIGVFPYNPFQAPVVIDATGQAPALALGLLEGQLREVLAGFGLIRRARLELDSPREAELEATALQRLGVAELTEEERALCPPVLVIAGSETFRDPSFIGVIESGLPVKALLLSDAGDRIDAAPEETEHHTDLGILAHALAQRNTLVVQSSLAHLDHLGHGLARAFEHTGPAIIHLHAPSPALHGFAPRDAVAQAELAVKTRAFPLFLFDPRRGGLFGTRLDITSNPEAASDWCAVEGASPLTAADWTVTESRFARHFRPLTDEDSGVTPLLDYLELDARARAGKIPFITTRDVAARRLAVGERIVRLVEDRGRDWRVLQELAGKVTPFTEAIRREAEQDVAARHESELAALRQDCEQRIAQLKTEFTNEAAQRIKERLLAMAGMSRSNAGD